MRREALLAFLFLAASAGRASAQSSGLGAAPEVPKSAKTFDCRVGGPEGSLETLPPQCLHMRLRTGDIDAGRILVNRGETAAFAPLRKIAEDSGASLEKRRLALQYLGRLPADPRVLRVLGRALDTEDLRDAAADGLSFQGQAGRRVLLRLLRGLPPGRSPCPAAARIFEGFMLGRQPMVPDPEILATAELSLGRADCAPAHESAVGVVVQAGSLAPVKGSLPVLASALAAADRGGFASSEEARRLAMGVFYFLQDHYVEGYAPLLPKLRACQAIQEVRGLVDGIPYEAFRRQTRLKEEQTREKMHQQSLGEALPVDGTTPVLLKK